MKHVRTRLAVFKAPKEVRVVAEPPRNASGKILKRSCATTSPDGSRGGAPGVGRRRSGPDRTTGAARRVP